MNDIKVKGHFTYACIQGLGGNFNLELRAQLAQTLFNLAQERPVDAKNLLMNFFDPVQNNWQVFTGEVAGLVKIDDLKNLELPPIIKTMGIQRDMSMIKSWLDKGDSFILVGPEGCGKNLMIRNQIRQMKST